MLAHSPPLPLTVDYGSERGITAEDEEGILLALEQRHRVRHLRLALPVLNLQKLVMAIDGEFLILEHLIVYPTEIGTILMLPETLQAPHLRHLMLGAFARPILSRLHPTAESLVSLFLIMSHQSAYFQPKCPAPMDFIHAPTGESRDHLYIPSSRPCGGATHTYTNHDTHHTSSTSLVLVPRR